MPHLALRSSLYTLALASMIGGCAFDDSGGGGECIGAKCDNPSGNGSVVGTTNSSAGLLIGYHSLFDRTSAQCVSVDADLARGAEVNVGSVSETFQLAYVRDREELARELGVDLGLKVKYPSVNADAAVSLLHRFKSTTTTVNLLLKLSQEYTVRNRHPLEITGTGQQKLDAGIDKFVQTCGTHYINGVRFGGHLYLLITYEATNEESALDLKADLGLQQGAVGTEVDADIKAKLNRAASRSDVRTTVKVSSTGFTFGGQEASSSLALDLIGGDINEAMFQRIDQIRLAMKSSVDNDACRDAGDGKCGDVNAPGYYENAQRAASVRGVELGFYDSLANITYFGESPFLEVRERLLLVERYVRDWAELEERMAIAYQNEINPFLDAPSNLKASYQLAPPAAPKNTPTEVLAIANGWMDDFFPETGPQIGWVMQKAVQAQVDCWSAASADLYHSCSADDTPADQSAAWLEVLAEINRYAGGGRVLPLQYKAGGAVSGAYAAEECQGVSTEAIAYRLPTLNEAKQLAPLVGYGNLSWPGSGSYEIWFDAAPGTNGCTDPDFPYPFYEHEPGKAPTVKCAESETLSFFGRKVVALCVPSSGPIPLVEAP